MHIFHMGFLETTKCLSHVMSTLNTMRQNGEFCDLVFELSNCKFSAHRLVMAAWSLPMRNLLQLQSTCTQHLHVAYDKSDVFHMFMKFMYTGDLPAQVTNISALLLLSATFQMPLLMELCEEKLKNNTNMDNVIEICDLSMKFELPDLEQHCVEFLCKHLKEITQRQEFYDLTPAQINALLESEHLLKYDHGIKLSLISSWLAEDTSHREQFLALLLKHIEWSKMQDDILKEIIQTENVFTSNPSSLYLLLQTAFSSNFNLGPHKSRLQALQKQYSCRLNSISNSSDILNSSKYKYFQPIKFSLSSPSSGDLSVPDNARDSANIVGIKNELVQFMNFDKNELLTPHNSACSDVDQNCVNVAQDVAVSADNISQCMGFSKTSSESLHSIEMGISSEEPHVGRSQSTDVKNRMRRQLVKPHRFIRDSEITKSRTLKTSINKTKKSGSRQQHRSGRPKEQKRMTTRQASIKLAEAENAGNIKPGLGNMAAKVSPVTGMRTKNGPRLLQSCSQCDYTTYNRLSLQKHHKQVHEGNCLFCCSLCSFKSKWSKEYYEHMKQSHFPGPPFHCDDEQCEYSTDKFQLLVSHRRQHSDLRPFVCDICLMAFRSKNNVYQHFKIHSDEKKFECPECGRSFKLKNTLEQHLVTHSDLRPYLCDLCGFCTKFQSHLISHKRIHTGDVYYCDFQSCTYFTPKKSQLKSHMRSHLGIRCHVCGSCGKAFIEKSHLIRHERTHSSERAHVCKECTYSSTRADKLREHVQKHHSNDAVRAKAVPSVSKKKLGASRKGKVKVTSKGDRKFQGEAGSDNDIEVVVVKNKAEYPVSAKSIASEAALSNILIGNDINMRMFHTDFSQQLGLPVAPTEGTRVNSEFIKQRDQELCAVDVFSIKESAFGCQVQPIVVEKAGDFTSISPLEQHAIMACSSVEGDRIVAAEEIISRNKTKSADATVLSYTTATTGSSHFSTAYTETDSQHGFTSTNSPSAEIQQFFHSQQNLDQQHRDLQEHADIEQSDFLSDENYLY